MLRERHLREYDQANVLEMSASGDKAMSFSVDGVVGGQCQISGLGSGNSQTQRCPGHSLF